MCKLSRHQSADNGIDELRVIQADHVVIFYLECRERPRNRLGWHVSSQIEGLPEVPGHLLKKQASVLSQLIRGQNPENESKKAACIEEQVYIVTRTRNLYIV